MSSWWRILVVTLAFMAGYGLRVRLGSSPQAELAATNQADSILPSTRADLILTEQSSADRLEVFLRESMQAKTIADWRRLLETAWSAGTPPPFWYS